MLCIAGKNLIAVEALEALSRSYELVCVPNPSDDGEDGWQPSLRRAAQRLGVDIVELADVYAIDDLCFLSLEYSELIRTGRFASDRLFNVHFSLLPKYRGCNTSVWPILNGETEHGVTLHVIDDGVDTGPIIDSRSFPLAGMTAYDAYMACQRLGVELALEWVPRLVAGDFTATPQGEGTTYRRSALDYGLSEIDSTASVEDVLRRVLAFTFPAYQMPTFQGRTIARASAEPFPGAEAVEAADGTVYLLLS